MAFCFVLFLFRVVRSISRFFYLEVWIDGFRVVFWCSSLGKYKRLVRIIDFEGESRFESRLVLGVLRFGVSRYKI